jgi:CheY-like chemotaxis protein
MNQKKILVVDDNKILLKTLCTKLAANGYAVLTAENGADAVSAVRRERPNLILLDINFPPDVAHGGGVAWDGLLIMSWLQRTDAARGIPVILITGEDAARNKDRALSAGAAGFFQKPVDHESLLAAIERLLEPSAPGASSA